ncbi:MAG TPA: GtrA family protein [Vicinamibacterales bacterium]|nr:GtrA family protein [Vicinamibacterales bacterium]
MSHRTIHRLLADRSVRFVRFSIAGATGFAAQIAIVGVLANLLGIYYLAATAIAVEAAIVINFLWHERWTWRDRTGSSGAFPRFLKFNALTAATSIIGSVVITGILVEYFTFSPMLANVISVIVLSVINFVGADSLVFRATATLALVMLVVSASSAQAATEEATLQAKTKADFAKYVAAVEARRTRDITNHEPFLDIERLPAAQLATTLASLKRGEVIVTRGGERDGSGNELSIDGGQVNHWRGTVFVPKVKLDALLKVLQEPQSDKHKQEDVLSSRVVSRDGDSQKVYLRLRRTKFVTVVYDTEYDVDYKRLSPDRALSNSISTKVVEVENAGTPTERALPEGNDSGYMWRLNSYWRYKQFEDGVLVEIESLTLSRNLPAIIGPLIRPIVNSTARESMTRTLASVRARFM